MYDADGEQRGSLGKSGGDQGRYLSFEGWSGCIWQVTRDAGSDGRHQEAETGGESLGTQHFMLERAMRRQRKSVMMAQHRPFVKKYNKRMDALLVVETRKIDCEFQPRELWDLVATAELLEKITEKEVRLKMITEEWLVIDDTLDLLQGCSDKAMKGKVAHVWQMTLWDDSKEEQKGCSNTAELKKRETADLKEKAQTDRALYLAMQLG